MRNREAKRRKLIGDGDVDEKEEKEEEGGFEEVEEDFSEDEAGDEEEQDKEDDFGVDGRLKTDRPFFAAEFVKL